MSRETEKLREAFEARLGESAAGSFYAKVKEVSESARTCRVERSGVLYGEVLLYAVENADLKGFCLVPAVGSTVLVSRVSGSERLFVEMFSEVDKLLLTIGDKQSLAVSAGEMALAVDKTSLKATPETLELLIDKTSLKATADTLELEIDKTSCKADPNGLELHADQSTIKATPTGLTLGKGASGLKKTLSELCDALSRLTVPTGVGPSGVPVNMADFQRIKQELNNYLE